MDDHDALRLILAIAAAHRTCRLLVPHTVAGGELHQEPADVGLGRGAAHMQPLADLGIRQSPGDFAQHLTLTVGDLGGAVVLLDLPGGFDPVLDGMRTSISTTSG